jgi:hypothetical protein
MKQSLLALVLGVLALLAGCGKNETATAPAGTNATAKTPSGNDYLSTITRGQQNAEKTVDTSAVQKAIDLFNVEKGRYPKDLNELVQEKFMPVLPNTPYGTKLDYDSASGKVSVTKQ